MNSNALHHFAKVSALETDRYIPTPEEIAASVEAMELPELVAILGGTITRNFPPMEKTYSLRSRVFPGLEFARVTFTQKNCLWYSARLFNDGVWANVAIFGDMECVELGW